jgi:hypothetical protein
MWTDLARPVREFPKASIFRANPVTTGHFLAGNVYRYRGYMIWYLP